VNFDGSDLKLLTPEKGTHSINPSPNWDFFTTTYSTTTNSPITLLKDSEGNTLKTLAESDIAELKENN
jgi:dipeptidyl-peptidase-4